MKILIADAIADEGIRILQRAAEVEVRPGLKPEELKAIIGDYEALIVRSQTKVTADILDAAARLQVVGRAGVGTDNIDLDAATRRGIVVVNSPEGNIVSTAEHTIGLLLALARGIPKAEAKLRAGVWDRSIKGSQLRGKVLGIIGLGRVGTEVAEMAKGFRMDVIAYDPLVSAGRAERLGVRMVGLEELLATSDFVTIHVPLNTTTRGMLGAEQLKLLKPTAMVINCARGGLIDEAALSEALKAGRLAGAAIDVYDKEPATDNILVKSDKVVVTPHLAASTTEAEASAGVDIAEQVAAVLQGRPARSPVNIPAIPPEALAVLGPYIGVGTTIGRIAAQLLSGQLESLTIRYQGDIAQHDVRPVKVAVLAGLLDSITDERVNMVNADFIATSRGLRVSEEKESTSENFGNLVTLTLSTPTGSTVVAGTSLRGRVYLVRVNDFWLEIEPTGGYMLFTEHTDRPGMIGAVGTIIGKAQVNISQMQVSRELQRGGAAMMVLCLDDPLPDGAFHKIQSIPNMQRAVLVRLSR